MRCLKRRREQADRSDVLRPATTAGLDRLRQAAFDADLELDTALVRLGVLPPLDLDEIRGWLCLDGIELVGAANADGHRVIAVMIGRRVVARIHHDGRVVASGQLGLLATA
jgi:hypothetical protein